MPALDPKALNLYTNKLSNQARKDAATLQNVAHDLGGDVEPGKETKPAPEQGHGREDKPARESGAGKKKLEERAHKIAEVAASLRALAETLKNMGAKPDNSLPPPVDPEEPTTLPAEPLPPEEPTGELPPVV